MVKLAGLSREMEKNHFDMPDLAVENRDEMGELVTAFNRMKHSMGDYISTLKRNHEMTELWGHVQRAEAGNGIPVQARYQPHWKNRAAMGRRDAE